MNATGTKPPPLPPDAVIAPEKALRKLFLTLFLRGRGARGLKKEKAPGSVGSKLWGTLLLYALVGCLAFMFLGKSTFALAVYLHGMTFVFLGMFIAASAGEILFNKEEADILLHRPIHPRTMLWAKIRVLVEVSLWLAGAFNLVGLGVGWILDWRFPFVHVLSTALQALFCTGCVVLLYQLCLRWFGRERLENLMTAAQVLVSMVAVMGGQIIPRFISHTDGTFDLTGKTWWIGLLPPAWFAGLDDALAGTAAPSSWVLAGVGIVATGLVLWLAFGKLAHDYEAGLQTLNESRAARPGRGNNGSWLERLVRLPPLKWWLRDPVSRASFLLTGAYLFRDRDVKLRVYPGLAPILVIPVMFLFQSGSRKDGTSAIFGVLMSGMYVCLVPLWGLQLIRYSQQWQAADIFRLVPIAGPGLLSDGARRAVVTLLALPIMVLLAGIVWVMRGDLTFLSLLLPGVIAMPLFALVAGLGGHSVPLSQPPDEAKSAGRTLYTFVAMFVAMGVAGVAAWAWSQGWFGWFLAVETMLVIMLCSLLRLSFSRARWSRAE